MPPASVEACPDCGALLGGQTGCDTAFHELGARALSDVRFAYRRRAVVDAYCLQHPAYIDSLKSFAAHLCGLCAAVERAHDPRAGRTIWSDLSVPADAATSPIRAYRGTLTLLDAHRAATAGAFRTAVDAWIADVVDCLARASRAGTPLARLLDRAAAPANLTNNAM
jgi:hypothetical protein